MEEDVEIVFPASKYRGFEIDNKIFVNLDELIIVLNKAMFDQGTNELGRSASRIFIRYLLSIEENLKKSAENK